MRHRVRGKMAAAVSKGGTGQLLFIWLQIIPDVTTASLQNVVNDYIESGSTIECDGYKSYPGLEKVTVNPWKYEAGELKWVHVAGGNFKAFQLVTYHGNCFDYQSCLDKLCFLFDRRVQSAQLFSKLAHTVAISCPLMNYADTQIQLILGSVRSSVL